MYIYIYIYVLYIYSLYREVAASPADSLNADGGSGMPCGMVAVPVVPILLSVSQVFSTCNHHQFVAGTATRHRHTQRLSPSPSNRKRRKSTVNMTSGSKKPTERMLACGLSILHIYQFTVSIYARQSTQADTM